MTIHLFNARLVAKELAHKEIDPKECAYYLLASFVIFVLASYSGLTSANPLWTWLSLYEGVVVVGVAVLGIAKAYEAAGGESNPNFIVEFTCLSVPVSVTTLLVVWPIYWGVVIGLRKLILTLWEGHSQFIVNLGRIGADFFDLLTFLAVVMVQVVTFYRITRLLAVVNEQRR